jgi:DNA-binding NarL/FixJ family response regulator
VVILTMHARQKFMEKAYLVGAKGYVLKDAETDELLDAIRLVHEGETYFKPLV